MAEEAMKAKHTPTPWFVRDFRATEMKRLGWTGPAIDRILITNATGAEIEAASGANSVIARIQFDNRDDLLTDGNRADADFIVTACNSYSDLVKALQFYASEWQPNGEGDPETPGLSRSWVEPTDELQNDGGRKARAALAKSRTPHPDTAVSP